MTTEARAPRAHVPQAEKSPCSSKDPAQKKERQKEIDFLKKKKENHPTLLLKKNPYTIFQCGFILSQLFKH